MPDTDVLAPAAIEVDASQPVSTETQDGVLLSWAEKGSPAFFEIKFKPASKEGQANLEAFIHQLSQARVKAQKELH